MKDIYFTTLAYFISVIIGLYFINFHLVIGDLESETIQIIKDLTYIEEKSNNTKTVESFNPSVLYIEKGDTVKWNNTSNMTHTITSIISYGKPIRFDHLIESKDEYEYRFYPTGVFNYYCKIHPFMIGEIVVSTNSSK